MNEALKKYFKGDAVIWAVILALSITSLLAVYSSTYTLAYKNQGGNTAYYVMKHFTIQFIGLIIIFVTHLIPYKFYSRLSQLFLLISIPMLALTLVFGRNINDATRFLTLPGLGFTFQTSDFAKLALIMYIARLLSLKQDEIKDFKKAFLPLIIPVGIVCLLISTGKLQYRSYTYGNFSNIDVYWTRKLQAHLAPWRKRVYYFLLYSLVYRLYSNKNTASTLGKPGLKTLQPARVAIISR